MEEEDERFSGRRGVEWKGYRLGCLSPQIALIDCSWRCLQNVFLFIEYAAQSVPNGLIDLFLV